MRYFPSDQICTNSPNKQNNKKPLPTRPQHSRLQVRQVVKLRIKARDRSCICALCRSAVAQINGNSFSNSRLPAAGQSPEVYFSRWLLGFASGPTLPRLTAGIWGLE